MSEPKQDVVWTVKVDKKMDAAVQATIAMLGFTSKAELTREAVREYLIRHKLFSLLGGEPSGPIAKQDMPPEVALHELSLILKKLPKKILEEEISTAEEDVANTFFGNEE